MELIRLIELVRLSGYSKPQIHRLARQGHLGTIYGKPKRITREAADRFVGYAISDEQLAEARHPHKNAKFRDEPALVPERHEPSGARDGPREA
jgi:predicted DNA-binding transcriptional regulator AlpA